MSEESKFLLELLSPIITVLAAILGVLLVIWQVRKQAQHSAELQKTNIQQDIKRKLYSDIIKTIDKSEGLNIKASAVATNISSQYAFAINAIAEGITHSGITISGQDIAVINGRFCDAVIKFISLIERYEIIDPRIKIFQTAFSCGLDSVNKEFQPLFIASLKLLPFREPRSGEILPRAMPSQEYYENLMELANAYSRVVDLVGCYIHDFRIEAQNLLLGELFNNQVPKRKPIDPYFHVISIDNYEVLKAHFEQTDWHKRGMKGISDTEKEYSNCKTDLI